MPLRRRTGIAKLVDRGKETRVIINSPCRGKNMADEQGAWIMQGMDWDDPRRIKTYRE